MSIPTQMSLVGFVASAPELHFTKQGAECCRLRVGVEQWRKEVDGELHQARPDLPRHGRVREHRPRDLRPVPQGRLVRGQRLRPRVRGRGRDGRA